MNIQGWYSLGLTGLTSCCPSDSQESSLAPKSESLFQHNYRFTFSFNGREILCTLFLAPPTPVTIRLPPCKTVVQYHSWILALITINILNTSVNSSYGTFTATSSSLKPHSLLKLWQPLICFPCLCSVFSFLLYKWNDTKCKNFEGRLFYSIIIWIFTQVTFCINSLFWALLLTSVPWYVSATAYLSIQPVKDIWVASVWGCYE